MSQSSYPTQNQFLIQYLPLIHSIHNCGSLSLISEEITLAIFHILDLLSEQAPIQFIQFSLQRIIIPRLQHPEEKDGFKAGCQSKLWESLSDIVEQGGMFGQALANDIIHLINVNGDYTAVAKAPSDDEEEEDDYEDYDQEDEEDEEQEQINPFQQLIKKEEGRINEPQIIFPVDQLQDLREAVLTFLSHSSSFLITNPNSNVRFMGEIHKYLNYVMLDSDNNTSVTLGIIELMLIIVKYQKLVGCGMFNTISQQESKKSDFFTVDEMIEYVDKTLNGWMNKKLRIKALKLKEELDQMSESDQK
ncbi:MAG: hypothetical protein EZS28_018159 [Streblomastix strix]|uniref:Uncharacterized protein n=1 Tax=Streblomastix strix TaxID=222440 RepID=A0A5J4VUL2_9EUKA|nr:MAG: hypothetical protein EZS28_018159 [Streblomastix strix]